MAAPPLKPDSMTTVDVAAGLEVMAAIEKARKEAGIDESLPQCGGMYVEKLKPCGFNLQNGTDVKNDKAKFELDCGHSFHQSCIKKEIQKSIQTVDDEHLVVKLI